MYAPLAARLAARTDRSAGPDACWLWQGIRNSRGYGRVYDQGHQRLAHRAAYEVAFGPIPDGLEILHSCDVPLCVNPGHLRAGTHADNQLDMVAKQRHGPRQVLDPALVLTIRSMADEGLRPSTIGRRLGLGRYVVADVVNGRSWRFVA